MEGSRTRSKGSVVVCVQDKNFFFGIQNIKEKDCKKHYLKFSLTNAFHISFLVEESKNKNKHENNVWQCKSRIHDHQVIHTPKYEKFLEHGFIILTE